ncbi:BMA_0021/BMA_0022 family TOMM bacteriocin [Desulfogranum japonicum]|uniref:BMA_0021/BMA_0022 family TOMM bacteriocin n=1 Tax=Desulfogranum japonicum TaxID=231447 RepID=UPI0004215A4B|nr:BMA_0021/BMA_0022 family TOMM bacteriocin [Desulfogranum japonicum]
MDGTSAMMKFRTIYLQAIARSWRDAHFLEQLKLAPIRTLENYYGLQFQWDIDLKITTVSEKESIWDPVKAGGWVGRNPLISIWLPPPPGNPDHNGKAWAAYYDEFPTFLGDLQPRVFKSEDLNKDITKKQPVGEAYQLGMGQWKDFLEFGGVIMRLIAMAWADERKEGEEGKYRNQIVEELVEVQDTNKGATILNKWLGYAMPWNMDVQFKLSGWFGNSKNDEKQCCWDDIKGQWPGSEKMQSKIKRPPSCRNSLNFYIPNKPGKDPSIDAIALSAYNVTGDQYPFTCP